MTNVKRMAAGVLAAILIALSGMIGPAVAAVAAADAARAAIGPELRAAVGLMQAGRLDEAKESLSRLRESHPESNDVDFLLGQIAVAQGDYKAAIAHFRAILARDPALPRVRLELGRAFFLNGEDDNARHQFRLALAGGLPDAVVANVNRYLDAIRDRRGWRVDLTLGIAPDSNINAGPAIETVELFGQPFILSEDARERSGVGFKTSLGGQYYQPVTDGVQLRLGARVFATEYGNGDFDDYAGSLHAGPRFAIPKGDVSLLLTANRRWYGGEPYARALGGRIEVNRRITERLSLGGALERQRITYDRNSDQTGPLTALVAVATYGLTPNSYLRLLAGVAREDAAVEPFRNTAWRTGFGYLREFAGGLTATVEPEVTFADYDERLAAFEERREDWLFRSRFTLLNRRWSLFGFAPEVSYIYSMRDSTIALYDFDRHQVEIGVTREF